MEVSNISGFFGDWDAFHVTGDVRNQHDRRLSDIEACVAMHDAGGNTIGVGWKSIAALDPSETDSFDVKVSFWKYKPDRSKMGHYSLQVYNEHERQEIRRPSLPHRCGPIGRLRGSSL